MIDKNLKVLVVDDMATVRMVVSQCLDEMGFKNIVEAPNGQAAWDVIANEGTGIGLILSDWNMPKLTGVELVKLLRGDKRYAKIPFILVTTEKEAHRVLEAVKAGIDDYVVKPFTVVTLGEKLKNVERRKLT
jgi:two-component system chemotaxis response regulator CheY